jgi:hypothetical protein
MTDRERLDPEKRGPKRTICEVLREIHRATDDPKIHELADIAHGMAKRMDAKLREHKESWDAGFWAK